MTATLEKAPVVARKRSLSSFEQVELWPRRDDRAEVAGQESIMPEPVLAAVAHTASSTRHVENVVDQPARAPRAISRKIVTNHSAQTPPAQPARHIARFLKVNGAIDGVRSQGIRFDLPTRGLSQMLLSLIHI